MPGAVRMVFQALCMFGIIAPFPAVESLRGDAEVATGEPGIVLVGAIVIEPFKSLFGLL